MQVGIRAGTRADGARASIRALILIVVNADCFMLAWMFEAQANGGSNSDSLKVAKCLVI